MKSKLISVSLENLFDNPYQPRTRITKASIKDLAKNILDHGLLQKPTGRPAPNINGYYELAFGHRRLAAVRLLDEKGTWPTPGQLEINVADLDDQTMFEFAISENESRAELTPIERARAMAIYRDNFGKNSKEIAKLFGLSDSTVRNELRLLDLPANVQKQVDAGKVSINAARQLMGFKKIAPDLLEEATKEIETGNFQNPAEVSNMLAAKIRTMPNAMSFKTDPETTRIDHDLWPVGLADLPINGSVSLKLFLSSFPNWAEFTEGRVKSALKHVTPKTPDPELNNVPSLLIEHVLHMKQPPACTQCPFHTLMDGIHYCGVVQCFRRKKKEWLTLEAERVAGEMGLEVYNSREHGKIYDQWFGYVVNHNPEKYEKLLKEKPDQIKVKPDSNGYWDGCYPLTNHKFLTLVHLNPEKIRTETARVKRQAAERDNRQNEKEERRQWEINRELNKVFLWKHFLPKFLDVLPLEDNLHFLKALADNMYPYAKPDTPNNKAEEINHYKLMILFDLVMEGTEFKIKGNTPAEFLDHIHKMITKQFGLKQAVDLATAKIMLDNFLNEVSESENGQ